jgi:hypothetical protein
MGPRIAKEQLGLHSGCWQNALFNAVGSQMRFQYKLQRQPILKLEFQRKLQ